MVSAAISVYRLRIRRDGSRDRPRSGEVACVSASSRDRDGQTPDGAKRQYIGEGDSSILAHKESDMARDSHGTSNNRGTSPDGNEIFWHTVSTLVMQYWLVCIYVCNVQTSNLLHYHRKWLSILITHIMYHCQLLCFTSDFELLLNGKWFLWSGIKNRVHFKITSHNVISFKSVELELGVKYVRMFYENPKMCLWLSFTRDATPPQNIIII